MLEPYLNDLRAFVTGRSGVTDRMYDSAVSWPSGKGRNVVLKQETAVELGSPQEESVSFVLWVNNTDSVHDGRITIIGPDLRDIQEHTGISLSFGRVVVVGVHGFDQENSYARYRQMELLRYEIDLKGYMMRAVVQNHREWSRISRDAIDQGFSFHVLGSELIKRFKEKDYVRAAEVVFMIADKQGVLALRHVLSGAMRIADTMDKMAGGLAYVCTTCDYKEVCDETQELRVIHHSMVDKQKKENL